MLNQKKYQKQYRIENREKIKQYRIENREKRKQYYIDNREKILKKNRQYRIKNKKRRKEYDRKYYIDNREKSKQYRIDNKGKIAEQHRKYYINNPISKEEYAKRRIEFYKKYYGESKERRLKYLKLYQKNRLRKYGKSLKKYIINKCNAYSRERLNHKIRNAVLRGIKHKGTKAGRRWQSLVGYTLNDLMKRIKKTMPKEYTWQDFLDGKLHIDHIIPLSAFNFDKPEHTDFKRCWTLSNLRLLPAKENFIKHNKLDKQFQPALKI